MKLMKNLVIKKQTDISYADDEDNGKNHPNEEVVIALWPIWLYKTYEDRRI